MPKSGIKRKTLRHLAGVVTSDGRATKTLVQLHRTFLAIRLGSRCVRRAKGGARRAMVLFAPRSSPSALRHEGLAANAPFSMKTKQLL